MINLIKTNNDTDMLVTGVGARVNADQLKLTDADAFPLRNEGVNLLLGTVKEGDGDGGHGDGETWRWRDQRWGDWKHKVDEVRNG